MHDFIIFFSSHNTPKYFSLYIWIILFLRVVATSVRILVSFMMILRKYIFCLDDSPVSVLL